MTTLAERLRGVVGSGPSAAGPDVRPVDTDAVAETLGGEWRDEEGHRFLIIDRRYAPGYRHGYVAVVDRVPPWPQFHMLAGMEGPVAGWAPRVVFLDLETTGLAGGAGTYAFVVGLAWFDGAAFRTRQFFLSSYTAERALLKAVAEDAAAAAALVTYNGKSFDVPLMETRFVMHRMPTPFAALVHVDMVHPARRLWRTDDEEGVSGGCRLTMLEAALCGHRREGDVPAFEIPSRYFHYVRTGDARPLAAVLEHNRLDLLALALITGMPRSCSEKARPPRSMRARRSAWAGCTRVPGGASRHAPVMHVRRSCQGRWRSRRTPCGRTRCCRDAPGDTRTRRAPGAARLDCAAARRPSRARPWRRSRCITSIACAISRKRAVSRCGRCNSTSRWRASMPCSIASPASIARSARPPRHRCSRRSS